LEWIEAEVTQVENDGGDTDSTWQDDAIEANVFIIMISWV